MASKKGRPPTKGSIKKGEVRNPYGRPKDDESWAGVLRLVKNSTPEELAEMVGGRSTDLGRAFLQMPKNIQVKYLMALRGVAGFMFEPTSTMWNTIMDRDEGKVTDTHAVAGELSMEIIIKKASDIEEGSSGQ